MFVNRNSNLYQCVTFSAKISNCQTDVVVDSGSGITIISLELFNLIKKYGKQPLDIVHNHVSARTATGEQLDMIGTTVVELDLDHSVWYIDCHVVRNFKFSLLLGMDFLIKAGASIDLGKLEVTLGQQVIPVSVLKRPNQVPVCVVETLGIPARSEALLTGRTVGIKGTILVEPKYEITSQNASIYPARRIANVNNNEVPLKVVNPNWFPVKIFSGTCVGMAETIDSGIMETDEGEFSPNTSSSSWVNDVDISNCNLSQQEKDRLLDLLIEYQDVFVTSESDFGQAKRFSRSMDTGDNPPFRQRPYRIPQSQLEMVDKHIRDMLNKGIIQESNSPWSQPLVIVTKKDGSPRFCVDFRKLNSITKRQIFPMPRVDEVLDSLGDSCYFTTLDLASGYWQIPMDPSDMEKTAFCTRQGNWEFRVMPMGLVNSSFSFQKAMQLVLSGLQWNICMVYLDDVIVYSKSFDQHLCNLCSVFDRFKLEGLKLKPKKCNFCKPEVLYLGHVVGKQGIKPNPDKIEVIKNYPVPTTCNEVRSFVALVSYYR